MTEGITIETIPDLTKRILNEWKRKEKEALLQEKKQKEDLKIAIEKEKELTKKLKMARTIAAKMQQEYFEIEAKTKTEKRRQIEKNAVLEADVRSGKSSFKEFVQKGKSEDAIDKAVTEETAKELEKGLETARNKNLEILNLEKELLEIQLRIRNLLVSPGQILQKILKDLNWFVDQEMGLFIQDINNSQVALRLKKEEMTLVEKGGSLGSGHTWSQISHEQARCLEFSPILPLSVIPALKAELKKIDENAKRLTVTYFWKSKEIQIQSFSLGSEE